MKLRIYRCIFRRKCVSDISAQYRVNAQSDYGGILNSCRIASGEMISSEGVAYPQNAGQQQTQGQLFAARFSAGCLLPKVIIRVLRV